MKKFIIFSLFLFTNAFAVEGMPHSRIYHLEGTDFKYSKPEVFEFASTLPKNGWRFLDSSFSSQYLGAWGIIALSTGVMIVYDHQITKQTQRLGRFLKLGNDESTKATFKVGGAALLRRPSDLSSTLYFIGDGWVTIGLMSGFFASGMIQDSPRSLQVSSQLLQGLLLTGLTTQIIKRTTGRESPKVATKPGGRWKFFPSTSKYQATTSSYDAFPSGHLATTMTAFMIISENFPEYTWIKPVGATAMALLSFQMVNNSVHWASDYPLALGIGYMIGKTIVDNGRQKVDDPNQTQSYFSPFLDDSGKFGLAWNVNY
ncbi:MAG: phosphatase PAP2 family protein [Bacteriovorax sp.]|nr:phosphatase PAP2 family protein [Bacteriovorax sp.]